MGYTFYKLSANVDTKQFATKYFTSLTKAQNERTDDTLQIDKVELVDLPNKELVRVLLEGQGYIATTETIVAGEQAKAPQVSDPPKGNTKAKTKTLGDGTIEEGSFVEGRLYGLGRKILSSGVVEEGWFVDGYMHGDGKVIFENGNMYVGTLLRGHFHGKGQVNAPDGTVLVSGKFVDGQLEEEE